MERNLKKTRYIEKVKVKLLSRVGLCNPVEWVAISFSRGSSQPRDQTQVSRIAGRCFNL